MVAATVADHGPKHAPGKIPDEGRVKGRTLHGSRRSKPPLGDRTVFAKLLDQDGPVTEVPTLKKEKLWTLLHLVIVTEMFGAVPLDPDAAAGRLMTATVSLRP